MVGVRPGKGGHPEGLGQRLIRAREQQKLSLEQISQDLHIPVNQLMGLEREDFSVFSAELYARGAYRAYAMYLGIYSRSASREFQRTLLTVREHVPLKLHTPESFLESLLNPRIIFIAGCVTVALVVGGYIAWQVQSFWRRPHLEVTAPTSSIITGTNTTITGIAEQQGRVTINGEPVLLTSDATFAVPLVLRQGLNPVTVEVVNAAGRTRTQHLVLLRVS
jgi:cytoskeletal protein RodZ